MPTSVFIVAAAAIHREAVAHALAETGQITVVGSSHDLEAALCALRSVTPSVVLIDTPVDKTCVVARRLRQAAPETRFVAIANADLDVVQWAEAGICAYATPTSSIEQLISVIEAAVCDELICSRRVAGQLIRRVAALSATERLPESRLTEREREILALMEHGLSNRDIASQLFLEVATVKSHVHHILEKLGARNRTEAVRLARSRV